MKESYLILTEAGNQIGLGHYKRCCSIRQEILNQNKSCELLLFNKGEINLDIDRDFVLDWKIDKKLLIKKAKEIKTVIIDSYLAKRSFYAFCIDIFSSVVVIDDYNRTEYGPIDLLLNPNPYFDNFSYDNQTAKQIKGGKDFVIISPPFRNSCTETLPANSNLDKIVVFLGGSDYRNLLSIVLSSLNELKEINIDVIVGNKEEKQKIRKEFKDLDVHVNLSSEEMFTAFNSARLVISGCGQTLHELAVLRKPTLGICIDIDQELNQKFYLDNGFLKTKISYETVDNIKQEVKQLLKSNTITNKPFMNTDGVKNIVSLINKLCWT